MRNVITHLIQNQWFLPLVPKICLDGFPLGREVFAENDGVVNNELKRYGAGEFLEDGTVQKDIEDVLKLLELKEPYTLVER